jgi:proteasome lid subunit RPN8/RPN11
MCRSRSDAVGLCPPLKGCRFGQRSCMSSVDEPIFEAEETGESEALIDLPDNHLWVGAVPEAESPPEMPTVYLDWTVAHTLQQEGQRSIREDREVAGILLGTANGNSGVIKVSHIAIARDEDSSPVHFKFTYSVWDDLMDQMEEMSREAGEELKLVSWYHTHPNMAVFLSRYDLRTHRDFHRPYQFALVLAPRSGTADTSVGFFVNRGVGLPLLPGVRIYDGPSRKEVAGQLPWRFQVIEVEGIEEGEPGDPEDEVTREHVIPVLHQIGLVKGEDPRWLTLGEDRAEGAVLPILEGMAASVVETKADRIGVLLGTKTPDNHITITRVRFLGSMSEDPEQEHNDIVTSLRFMASTFPAAGKQKILGVARIVSPHRFKAGDVYDPLEHNIRIAQLLGEVGYDLDQVPFQVGLVLYPGIEKSTVLFQVFGQYKTAPPLPKMSLQAMALASQKPNERWEPVAGTVFEVEMAPEMDVSDLSQPIIRPMMPPEPPTPIPPPAASPDPDMAGSGIDWDELPEEEGGSSLSGAFLLVAGMILLLGLLVVFILLRGGDEATDAGGDPSADPSAPSHAGVDPYKWEVAGCGAAWNPGVPCVPFAEADDTQDSVDLLLLQRLPEYLEHTFEPIQVWLIPSDGRPRQDLTRRNLGDDKYAFAVERTSGNWEETWGDATVFDATLVILPRGSEILVDDELSYLRRTETLRIAGPPPTEDVAPAPRGGTNGARSEPPPISQSGDLGGWVWASGGAKTSVGYNVERRSLQAPLLATGNNDAAGAWRVSVLGANGAFLASSEAEGLSMSGGRVDLGGTVTRALRADRVTASIKGGLKEVVVSVQPPKARGALRVTIPLKGALRATGVEHKICVMMEAPEGAKADGQAMIIGPGALMRATHAPGKCQEDGGNGSRWAAATFGPGPAELRWAYLGGELASAKPNIGRQRRIRLDKRWSEGVGRCLAVTIVLEELGTPATVPRVQALYDYEGGRCR